MQARDKNYDAAEKVRAEQRAATGATTTTTTPAATPTANGTAAPAPAGATPETGLSVYILCI